METKKRYFALLREPGKPTEVATAPYSHVIPAKEFSELVSGQELLAIVQKDALDYRQKVTEECEKIKEEAHRDGFAAGFQAWGEMIALLEKEIARVRDEMQKSIMPISVRAAKKIVGAEIKQRPEAIEEIVMATAKVVAQHKKIVIYVCHQDFAQLESGKNKLKNVFEELESLSIRERDDLTPGDCIIETEGGIINARLQDRWLTLEAALQSMQESIGVKGGSK